MALNAEVEWSAHHLGLREGRAVKIVGRSGGREFKFVMLAESAQQLMDELSDRLEELEADRKH